jgi:hypothetical protein
VHFDQSYYFEYFTLAQLDLILLTPTGSDIAAAAVSTS